MKNKKGFTLIELLAVIVVLAIVMVLAVTTVLPYMNNAREEAFRIEATSLVDAAEKAKDLYTLNQVTIENSATNVDSCSSTNKICFTVKKLIDLGIYEGDVNSYSGKVEITNISSKTPTYTSSIKKNNEFKIIAGTAKDYTNKDTSLSTAEWKDEYAKCTCN